MFYIYHCESDVELHWSNHLHKTRSVHSPVLETGQGPCALADRKGFDRAMLSTMAAEQ